MYLAYLYDEVRNLKINKNTKYETKYLIPDIINIISKIMYEGKSVQLVSKNEKFLDYIYNYFCLLDLEEFISYKETRLGEFNYTINEVNYDFDYSRTSKLYDFYKEVSLKENKKLLFDNLFYDMNFTDLTIDVFDEKDKSDVNKTFIKELYKNFDLIEEYFKKNPYINNVFVGSHATNTNKQELLKIIDKLLQINITNDGPINMLINNSQSLKTLIDAYNKELDYDNHFFNVFYNDFKSLLVLQKEHIKDILVYNELNKVFEYFNRIGAHELIPYIRKYDNITKLVAVLDRSIIKKHIDNLDLNNVDKFYEINEDFVLSLLSNASILKAKLLNRTSKMLNSIDRVISSNLSKFLEKNSKSNVLYYKFRPLLLTKTFKKNKTDYVINLDDAIFEEVININISETKHEKKEELYLVDTIIDLFKRKNVSLFYDNSLKLYYVSTKERTYFINFDYLLDKHELFTNIPIIYPISLSNLGLGIDKEIDRLVKSFYLNYPSASFEKKYYNQKEFLFDEKEVYDKVFKSEKLDDLEDFVKKVIKTELVISKKTLVERIKTLTKYKVNKAFLEYLDNLLLNMRKLNVDNGNYYFKKSSFRISDYKKLSEMPSFYLDEFLSIIKENSYDLSAKDYKLIFKMYLNINLSEDDLLKIGVLKK